MTRSGQLGAQPTGAPGGRQVYLVHGNAGPILAVSSHYSIKQSPTLEPSGRVFWIDDVFTPSPASRAGVRVGDFLVGLGGHRILSVGDFQTWLYVSGIGASVAATRLIFSLGRDRRIPGAFAAVSPRYGTPVTAIVRTVASQRTPGMFASGRS